MSWLIVLAAPSAAKILLRIYLFPAESGSPDLGTCMEPIENAHAKLSKVYWWSGRYYHGKYGRQTYVTGASLFPAEMAFSA
jgi:hypothetical protein